MIKELTNTFEDDFELYLRDISKYPKGLKSKDEAELAKKIKKGNKKAYDALIQANLRFVISVARNYQNQGLPLKDLVAEGNIGLLHAAERFDEKKNFKFVSYAVWWIRQAILQALANQSRYAKIPLNRVDIIHKLGKERAAWEQKHKRECTLNDLLKDYDGKELDYMLPAISHPVSLDDNVGGNPNMCYSDIIVDKSSIETSEIAEKKSQRKACEELMKILNDREKDVIRKYFLDETYKTLDEIGITMDITRERVRQIKNNAIGKLRKNRKKFAEILV